jgi:hypothetical protein
MQRTIEDQGLGADLIAGEIPGLHAWSGEPIPTLMGPRSLIDRKLQVNVELEDCAVGSRSEYEVNHE